MIQPELPIVLASASPRRHEILKDMGLEFTVDTSGANERFDGSPRDTVSTLCERKARVVARRHSDALIIGADTVVAIGSRILGKPHDMQDAERMLRLLSGRWHAVFTGVCVLNTKNGRGEKIVQKTQVHFLQIPEEELQAYLLTDEPRDKAGAYAIQGRAGAFIDEIRGSWSGVVGLPMHTVAQLLHEVV